jgi:arginase family enzyme
MEQQADRILMHFDVDVIDANDFPAADVLHSGGLSYRDAMKALRIFISGEKTAGLVVTEFNVNRDPQGKLANRLIHDLASCFGAEIKSSDPVVPGDK